jgi:penicillin-binding protein 2
MRNAVLGGTCRGANLPGIEVCGKTGTAQNPHGPDHSAFMGFAPMSNPKIAIAVYVENAGFGATYGVPIGSLMMEKYLNGEISPARKGIEEKMMNANTIISSGRTKH